MTEDQTPSSTIRQVAHRRFSYPKGRKMSSRNSKLRSFSCSCSHCTGQKSKNIQRKSRPPTTDISIPGMDNVLNEHQSFCKRLLWTAAILLCTVSCLVLISFRIVEFLKNPVTVQVEVLQETFISFPAVTICPFYPFSFNRRINELRDEYAARHNISHSVITYWDDSDSIHFLDLLELPEVNVTNLWTMGGVDQKRMGIYRACQFETKKNCEVPIKIKKLVTYLGICISLTYAKELYFDGAYNGLELKLFEHGSETSYWQHMLLLHHRKEDPTHFLYLRSGEPLHPFKEITIVFFIKKYRRVNTKQRPCKANDKFERCQQECVEYHLTNNVTCRLPYMTSEKMPLCTSPVAAKHTYRTTLSVYSQLEDLCSHCHRACMKTYYSMIQDVVMVKNCTWPKILMQDNTVERVQEMTPYTVGILLSEIGGCLGLFLGACVLTGLQVLEAISVHIAKMLNPSKSKPNKHIIPSE